MRCACVAAVSRARPQPAVANYSKAVLNATVTQALAITDGLERLALGVRGATPIPLLSSPEPQKTTKKPVALRS